MTDLDQFELRRLAVSGEQVYVDQFGREHCVVPRDLLLRVTAEFDIRDVEREINGRRH